MPLGGRLARNHLLKKQYIETLLWEGVCTSSRETCVWLVDAPFVTCKRQCASLETQKDGLEGYPGVLLQDEATGPVGCQGRGRTRKWWGGQKTGTLEAHTKKTIYGLKTKKPCSLSHGMHIHDQLWRADMFPFHFKPVFSGLELDMEKQPEVVTFPSA